MKAAIFLTIFIISTRFTGFSQVDTTYKFHKKWYQTTVVKTAAIPVVLMGYGLSVSGDHGLFYSSYKAKVDINRAFPGFHTHVDDYLAFSPAALAAGLKLGGVKTEHSLQDGFFLFALSSAFTEGLALGLKYTTRELRPDGSNYESFPSAHTAFAFSGAEFLHQEYINQSPWYSIAGYTLATTTGAMRMMNNKHWLSDVAFGAGMGILCTKVVYLVYPALKKEFSGRYHKHSAR
jgi:membrane-associated phospholipid phosphatase